MTFFSRLKLFFGIILVIAICGALFLFLEYSMTRIAAKESYIDSDSYTVGLDYSGIVETQYKVANDTVKAGDPLFEIRSQTLSDAIRNNEVAAAHILYSVNSKGLVVITAAADGRVREVKHNKGAFVPANETLATIDLTNGTYIKATYKLSAPDYSRLGNNSRVVATLPDGSSVEGTVYDVSFVTVDKQVLTTVKARVNVTNNKQIFTAGTPVDSTLIIDDNSMYSQLVRYIKTALGRG